MEECCAYSFADLYRAAFGKTPEPKFLVELFSKPRPEINRTVAEWAKAAGWKTEMKKSADGQEYLAFGPLKSIHV
ncbi:MAG: hypothetical protein M1275_02940 [Patescibacteria group bacterium]|nr:hypothetical protein [Patescibacteria group bacterium]